VIVLYIDNHVFFVEMFSGKKKEQVVESSDDEEDEEEDSDSDYIETFGQLDIEENSISEEDSSYAPDKEDTATASFVKPKVANKVANLKRKGKIHLLSSLLTSFLPCLS